MSNPPTPEPIITPSTKAEYGEHDEPISRSEIIKNLVSEDIYSKEIALVQNISLSKPEKNLSWEMSSLNHQNFLTHGVM